jgi:hypothetical protein
VMVPIPSTAMSSRRGRGDRKEFDATNRMRAKRGTRALVKVGAQRLGKKLDG